MIRYFNDVIDRFREHSDLKKVLGIVARLESQTQKSIRVVFDIGAGSGHKASILARSFPKAVLYCFEPDPITFEHLKKRMATFGGRVNCYNLGFYNTNDKIDFFPGNPSDTVPGSFLPEKSRRPIRAVSRRLDDFMKEQGIGPVDFMKISAGGVERELLEGGRDTLLRTENLFIEIFPALNGIHSHNYIEATELIHQSGFSLFGVYGGFFFTKLIRDKEYSMLK